MNDGFDGADDAIDIIWGIVGLDGDAQEGAVVPDYHWHFNQIVIPQAGVLVLFTVWHRAESHLIPPRVTLVADGLHAGNSGDLLAGL